MKEKTEELQGLKKKDDILQMHLKNQGYNLIQKTTIPCFVRYIK